MHPPLYNKDNLFLSLRFCNVRISEAVDQSCSAKKCASKNFANFTSVSSGTGASCKFCEILKNTVFYWTPPVAASGICTNQDFLFWVVLNGSFWDRLTKLTWDTFYIKFFSINTWTNLGHCYKKNLTTKKIIVTTKKKFLQL